MHLFIYFIQCFIYWRYSLCKIWQTCCLQAVWKSTSVMRSDFDFLNTTEYLVLFSGLWNRKCFALLLTFWCSSVQFLSLLDSSSAFNCEIIRDCYEAFALYCFERYLIACLGTVIYMPFICLLFSFQFFCAWFWLLLIF